MIGEHCEENRDLCPFKWTKERLDFVKGRGEKVQEMGYESKTYSATKSVHQGRYKEEGRLSGGEPVRLWNQSVW